MAKIVRVFQGNQDYFKLTDDLGNMISKLYSEIGPAVGQYRMIRRKQCWGVLKCVGDRTWEIVPTVLRNPGEVAWELFYAGYAIVQIRFDAGFSIIDSDGKIVLRNRTFTECSRRWNKLVK